MKDLITEQVTSEQQNQQIQCSDAYLIKYQIQLITSGNMVHQSPGNDKKSRWWPFVQYLNGLALQYSNGIQKPDHLASNLFSTIWIPD